MPPAVVLNFDRARAAKIKPAPAQNKKWRTARRDFGQTGFGFSPQIVVGRERDDRRFGVDERERAML